MVSVASPYLQHDGLSDCSIKFGVCGVTTPAAMVTLTAGPAASMGGEVAADGAAAAVVSADEDPAGAAGGTRNPR